MMRIDEDKGKTRRGSGWGEGLSICVSIQDIGLPGHFSTLVAPPVECIAYLSSSHKKRQEKENLKSRGRSSESE